MNENKDEILRLLTYTNKNTNERSIKRLALLVAQECPLSCRYCYANYGVYHVRGMMSSEIAKEALKKFYHNFNIETLQFFGGEPLLNLRVIRETLKFLTDIEKYPVINIESGLGVGKELVKLLVNIIREYEKWFKFELVVSIDGPEFIQDKLRPFKNGKGSYNTVSQNMRILKTVNQPKAIEVTYTQLHERIGFNKEKIKSFFKEEFEAENIMIVPVITNDKTLMVNVKEEYKFEEYLTEPLRSQELPEAVKRDIQNISAAMFSAEPDKYYCGAGVNNFVVDIKGDVYPCQMVVGRKKFKISNVTKVIDEFEQDILKANEKYIRYVSKLYDEKCAKCILRYSCGGCVFADVYLENSNVPSIPHEFCDKRQEIARKLLRSKFWEVLS